MTVDRALMLIVIAGLIVVILFQRACTPKCNPEIVKMPVKDTMWQKGQKDSMFKHPVMSYIPTDPKFIKGRIVEVPGKPTIIRLPYILTNLDTAEAIQEYFVKSIYIDTLKGSNVLVAIRDSVGMNKILGRSFQIKNNRLTVENNLNPNRNKVFVGFNLGLSTDLNHFVAGPQVSFLSKKDQLYNLSFTFPEKVVSFGLSWKIKIGK